MAVVAVVPVEDACCPRCTEYAAWIRKAADGVGLRDWMLTLEHEPPRDPANLATTDLGEEFRHARFRLREDFWSLEPAEQRYVLLHELCHVVLHELYETVRRGAVSEIGGAALRVFMAQVDHQSGRAADVFARALAPRFDLPEG